MEDARDLTNMNRYIGCIEEVKHRLVFVEGFTEGRCGNTRIDIESACLQLRKILELIAYAAIAPYLSRYKQLRQNSYGRSKDFREDYHAKKIFECLEKINPYFYPRPINPPLKDKDVITNLTVYKGTYLDKCRFYTLYDQVCCLMHADNPWGAIKKYENFRKRIRENVKLIRALLKWHVTIILHDDDATLYCIGMGDLSNRSQGCIAASGSRTIVDQNYYQMT